MTAYTVEPCAHGLHGRLRVPGDKSVSHRALLLAARAEGRSELLGLSHGEDVVHTARAMRAFGAEVERISEDQVLVDGGPSRLHEPHSVIDVGNSGTGIRLLSGWASGLPGLAVLAGDDSVAGRPMHRITAPLRAMGAHIDGRQDGAYPPLVVRGGDLQGIDYRLPVPSAQVKGAMLLAGLTASGATTVREEMPLRRHTEELMALAGADVERLGDGVRVRPSRLTPFRLAIPGDPSQAAFWLVGACVTPGSDLVVEHVYLGAGRTGFVDVLMRMGADLVIERDDALAHTADIRARFGPLRATEVAGPEVPSLIDEIPVLAIAAAAAEGTTVFRDAAELVVKETNRIATITSELRALGAAVEPRPDGLDIEGRGGGPIEGGNVESHGDHRIAMAMAIAGLSARSPVLVSGWEAVATSYPTFKEDLRRCVS